MAKSSKVKGPELAAVAAEMVSNITKINADFTQRTIHLIGALDDDIAYQFMVTLGVMDRSQGRIRIILMSPGGAEPSGWAIYDAIREARNEVWVDSYGSCWSMAALVMQAASVRRMSRSCRYMLHAGSMSLGKTPDQRNVIAAGIECQWQNKNYIQAISERSGLAYKRVWHLWNNEAYLTAEKCKHLGLIDDVIPYNEEKKK